MYYRFFILIMIIFNSVSIYADDKPYILDEIIVKEKKEDKLIDADTVIINSNYKSNVSSVPDILKNTSGIDIQRRSILTPKSSQVRIRGMDERRSQILLDGRTLNGTGVMGGFFVDWSSLSLLNYEKIEVSKGAFSAKYGNTLGGTINMVSAKIENGFKCKTYTGYKRYNTYSGGFESSYSDKNASLNISLSHNKTDGHLRNSQAVRDDFVINLAYIPMEENKIMFNIRYSDGDFNMPVANNESIIGFNPNFPESIGSYLTGPNIKFLKDHKHGDNSYFNKNRYEIDFSYKSIIKGFKSKICVFHNKENRQDIIFDYIDGSKILERESIPDRSWGWRIDTNKAFEGHKIGFGFSGNYQGYGGADNTYTIQNYYKPLTDTSDEWDTTKRYGIYVDDKWIINNKIDIYLGLRHEIYQGDRTADQAQSYTKSKPGNFISKEVKFDKNALLPKFCVNYYLSPQLSLHGKISRATRFPDDPAFYWFYSGYQPEIDPNINIIRKNLTFEDAMQYEIGLSYIVNEFLNIKTNFYYYQVDDYIRWIFGYSPSRFVYNIDSVNLKGIEFDIFGKLSNNLSYSTNYSFQSTKKDGDVMDASNYLDSSLSELPETKFNFNFTYNQPDSFNAEFSLRWVDKIKVPYGDSVSPDGIPTGKSVIIKELDDFLTVDFFLKIPVIINKLKGKFRFGVENLFDEIYEEEYGFPSSGQTVSLFFEMGY